MDSLPQTHGAIPLRWTWLNSDSAGGKYYPTVTDYLTELQAHLVEYQRTARRRERLNFEDVLHLRKLLGGLKEVQYLFEKLSNDEQITIKNKGGRLRQAFTDLAAVECFDHSVLWTELTQQFSPAWCAWLRLTLNKAQIYRAMGLFISLQEDAYYFTAKVRSKEKLTPEDVDRLHESVRYRNSFRSCLLKPDQYDNKEDAFIYYAHRRTFEDSYRRLGRVLPILSKRYANHAKDELMRGVLTH